MKRKLLKTAVAAALSGFCLPGVLAQDAWDAPKVPGADLSGELSGTYALYNVGADAFVTHGADWNTRAVANRLWSGDNQLDSIHKVTVTKTETGTIKFSIHGKEFLGVAGGGVSDIYVDVSNEAPKNNEFKFEAEGDDNTYTLTPTLYTSNPLDVSSTRGWIVTCDNEKGKGLTKWALIPEDSITNGNYATYKAKKEMYEIYEALTTAGTSETYTEALATAKAAYDAAASADAVRAATAVLLKAAAPGLTAKKVNASSLFKNTDMIGTGKLSDWGKESANPQFAVFEKYHGIMTLEQEVTDLPGGLYSVTFYGFYRQDVKEPATETAPVLTITSDDEISGKVPSISNTDFGVTKDKWKNENPVATPWLEGKPDNMQGAGEALAHEEMVAKAENLLVEDGGTLKVSVKVAETNQWFIWQGFDIYFQAESKEALKTSLQEKVGKLEALKDSSMSSVAKAAVEEALKTANDAENGETETLKAAIESVDAAITTAEASIAAYKKMGSAISYVDNRLDKLPAGANTSEYEALKKRYEAGGYTDENVQKEDTLRAVYAALATAAKSTAYEDGKDYTLAILNNGFETGELFPGWETTKVEFDSIETGVKPNSGGYEMPGGEGKYLFNSWGNGGNYGVTLSQTVENLPEGTYKLGFLYGSDDNKELTVIANGDTATFVRSGANTGPAQHDSLIATVGGDKILSITVIGGKENNAWYKVDNFTLTAFDVESLKKQVSEETERAKVYADSIPTGIKGHTALEEAVQKGTSVAGSSDKDALTDALAALTKALEWAERELPSVPDLNAELENAGKFMDVSSFKGTLEGETEEFESVTAALNSLKESEYTAVTTDLTDTETTFLDDIGSWDGDMVENNGDQHWSGKSTTYYEQSGAQWSAGNWKVYKEKTVKLPAGKYVLIAAGRSAIDAVLTMSVEGEQQTFPKGDTGYGIDIDGKASFSPDATYTNDGKGRGWEYRYCAFELDNAKEVTIRIDAHAEATQQWASICDLALYAASTKVPLNITAENQWATLILPFDADIPEKLTVYSCGEEVKDGVLSLTPVESTLAANTPYIVYAESGIDTTFTGLSTATEDEYTVGCMTGTFVEKDAPVGSSYVLGKQNGVVAFYKVEQKLNKKVGKYHAYLNASAVTAGTNVQVLKFPTRDLPSHVTAATAEAATVDVYSISGILVRSKVAAGEALKGLPKGIYIVNGEKKAVK